MNLESHFPLILDLCLKSSAILLTAFGIAWLARKASAARRHLVWLAAFIALAILPLTLAIPPRWSWSWQRPAPARSMILNTLPVAIPDLPDSPAKAAPVQRAWHLPGWPTLAGGAWLAGALLLLARQAAGIWKLRELRRRSAVITSGPVAEIAAELGVVEIRESPACAVPLTWGWRHPVILLPESAAVWPETQLRAALAHEFGHIARRDFLWRQLAQIVRAFFWPNPLVWLAVRALHRTQEQACDDLVLRRGASPQEYAMQLLEVARSLAAPMFASSQVVAMALPSTLEGRVRAIVDVQRDRRAAGNWSRISAALAIVAVIAGSAFAQVKSPPSENKPISSIIEIEAKFIDAPENAISFSDFPRGLMIENADGYFKALQTKEGVNILGTPRITTRSGQRATIEIADAPSPPAPGLKFEATSQISGNGPEIEIDFAATRTILDEERRIDDKPVAKTRVLKSNVKLTSGQTCISYSRDIKNGRLMLIAVTASIVNGTAPPPPKKMEPAKPPYGKPVPGKEGFITSPYAPDTGYIDVRGFPPGTEIKDPYTGKIFLVPNSSRALAAAERIILPSVEWKNATIEEAVKILIEQSRENDPEGEGVKIILQKIPPTTDTRITVSLKSIPVSKAVGWLTDLANLKSTATDDAIVISPTDKLPLFDTKQPITINAESTRYDPDKAMAFAEGNVVFSYGEVKISGSALRYDSKIHEVEVTGSAQVERGDNVVTCEKIIYWLDTGKMQTEGPSKTRILDKPSK